MQIKRVVTAVDADGSIALVAGNLTAHMSDGALPAEDSLLRADGPEATGATPDLASELTVTQGGKLVLHVGKAHGISDTVAHPEFLHDVRVVTLSVARSPPGGRAGR